MKLEKSEFGVKLLRPLNKQLKAVEKKYKVDNRELNKNVKELVIRLRYPVFELEYVNGVYVMTVRTADPRVDHVAIYVRPDGCEARVPWGFGRGNAQEIAGYLAKI